jgi:hypothetical protein
MTCLIFIYTPSSGGVEVSPYADVQPSTGFLRQLSPLEATGFALKSIIDGLLALSNP